MRNQLVVTVTFGVFLSLVSGGKSQETKNEPSGMSPLQIIEDCFDAMERQDFIRYVDHLSTTEQKLQAGYALFAMSQTLPQVDETSHEVKPEMLLLLRSISDVLKEHAVAGLGSDASSVVDALNQHFMTQLLTPNIVPAGAYASQPAAKSPRVRDVFIDSADKTLKDSRLFLIAALTELTRPVQFAGTASPTDSEMPVPAEIAREFRRQKWALYTRGDYAVAVATPNQPAQPAKDEAAAAPPSNAKNPAERLRIEFQRVDGVWKISRLLPVGMLPTRQNIGAVICTGPECNANVASSPSDSSIPMYSSGPMPPPAIVVPNQPR